MNKYINAFFKSKTLVAIEHGATVAGYIAASAFLTELANSDFAKQVSQHAPTLVTVGMVNILLAAALKYFNLKKSEALEEMIKAKEIPAVTATVPVQVPLPPTTESVEAKTETVEKKE